MGSIMMLLVTFMLSASYMLLVTVMLSVPNESYSVSMSNEIFLYHTRQFVKMGTREHSYVTDITWEHRIDDV